MSELVRGKAVLDVGCVEHSAEQEKLDTWLHKNLLNNAARIVGLDYQAEAVEELKGRGYDVVAGDAMTADLGERFDVVTAGEIIEHVENPGMLLRNLKRHMKPDGLLVLSTPNVFFPLYMVESIWMSPVARWNHEHVSWYCYFTLENMLTRCGFSDVKCYYLTRSRKLRAMLNTLHIACPALFSSTLVVVARN